MTSVFHSHSDGYYLALMAQGGASRKDGRARPSRLIEGYFFVALPSITVVQFVPSLDISYFMLYEVGDRIFMV